MAIIVYSKPACVYCDKTKALLTRLGLEYTVKVVSKDLSLEELFKVLNRQIRTIPQIVIDNKHIGGYNELVEHFINKGKINFKGEKIEEENKI